MYCGKGNRHAIIGCMRSFDFLFEAMLGEQPRIQEFVREEGGRGGLSRTQTHHDVSVYRLQYKHYDTYGRCRSVSDKHLRHGGSGYETRGGGGAVWLEGRQCMRSCFKGRGGSVQLSFCRSLSVACALLGRGGGGGSSPIDGPIWIFNELNFNQQIHYTVLPGALVLPYLSRHINSSR